VINHFKKKYPVINGTFSRIDRVIVWTALIFMSVQPLVFRIINIKFISPDITNYSAVDTGIRTDTFTELKMILLYTITGLLLLMFVYKLLFRSGWFNLTVFDAILCILCVFLILSVFMSETRSIALYGMLQMRIGALSCICYCLMFFIGFHVMSGYKKAGLLFIPLYIIGGVNALTSFLNFFGYNVVNSPIIKFILGVPVNSVATTAAEFSSTFGNVNYLSGFGGAMFAVFFSRLLLILGNNVPDKDGEARLLFGIRTESLTIAGCFFMTVASFSMIIVSVSASGFLTFVVMFVVITGVALMNRITKKMLLALASVIVICVAMFFIYAGHNTQVYSRTIGRGAALFGLTTANDIGDGAKYRAAPMTLATNRLSTLTTERLNANVSGNSGVTVEFPDIPEPGVTLGTGRVYIWKETLKLIAERPLFGYGMDTLTYNFPQFDLQKIANLEHYSVVVTKPHNVYLSYAYGAGIPALLAFLALNVAGLATLGKYITGRKKRGELLNPTSMCFMAGWAAYLIQALVNDDHIATTHVWWAFFGIALGMARSETEVDRAKENTPEKF